MCLESLSYNVFNDTCSENCQLRSSFMDIPLGTRLQNGVIKPGIWPPNDHGGIITSPILEHNVSQIDISFGRQIFVDDFTFQFTNLTRVWNLPNIHSDPVLVDRITKQMTPGQHLKPFSHGIVRDNNKYMLWYSYRDDNNLEDMGSMCYSESDDGVYWTNVDCQVVVMKHDFYTDSVNFQGQLWYVALFRN